MTYEEAIEYIKCGADALCCCPSNKRHGGDCEGPVMVFKAYEIAVEALERCMMIDETEPLAMSQSMTKEYLEGWNDCLKWAKGVG